MCKGPSPQTAAECVFEDGQRGNQVVLLIDRADPPPHGADLRSGHLAKIVSLKENRAMRRADRRIQKAK